MDQSYRLATFNILCPYCKNYWIEYYKFNICKLEEMKIVCPECQKVFTIIFNVKNELIGEIVSTIKTN